MRAVQALTEARLAELWEIAVEDAGLTAVAIELRFVRSPGRAPAWACPPGIPLAELASTGLTREEFAELSAHLDKHRVGFFAPAFDDEAEALAAMRHELQHVVQYEAHGVHAMFLAEFLRQVIAERHRMPARAMLQAATPLERQAHQAAFALVDRVFGFEALQTGVRRLYEFCGREGLEGGIDLRAVSAAALRHTLLKHRVSMGRTPEACADAIVPGGWAQLVSLAEFRGFATRAADLEPSRREVAQAEKPGRPWLPVVSVLLEGEDFGLKVLRALS